MSELAKGIIDKFDTHKNEFHQTLADLPEQTDLRTEALKRAGELLSLMWQDVSVTEAIERRISQAAKEASTAEQAKAWDKQGVVIGSGILTQHALIDEADRRLQQLSEAESDVDERREAADEAKSASNAGAQATRQASGAAEDQRRRGQMGSATETLGQTLTSEERVTRLDEIEKRARTTQYQVYAFLGGLLGIAGLAFAAGVIAHSMIFWGAAATVFLLAMTAIIVYIAQRLGIVANLISVLKASELKQLFSSGSGGGKSES